MSVKEEDLLLEVEDADLGARCARNILDGLVKWIYIARIMFLLHFVAVFVANVAASIPDRSAWLPVAEWADGWSVPAFLVGLVPYFKCIDPLVLAGLASTLQAGVVGRYDDLLRFGTRALRDLDADGDGRVSIEEIVPSGRPTALSEGEAFEILKERFSVLFPLLCFFRKLAIVWGITHTKCLLDAARALVLRLSS